MTALRESPLPRRNVPDPRYVRGDIIKTIFQMHSLVRWRLPDDACAWPPFLRGPDRPRREAAAAVRADIPDLGLHAVRAEGAFIGADPRLQRMGRKILVAIFAVRPQLQRHGPLSRCAPMIANRAPDSKGEYP